MLTEKSVKIRKEYFCNNCNYKTSDKKDYNKHLLTTKHKNNMFIDISLTNLEKKSEKSENKNNMFFCKCGKKYKSRQGFYLHKKKCMFIDNEENNCIIKSSDISNNQLPISNDVIMKLLNDNQELKNIIVQQQNQLLKQQEQFSELIPKVGNNNTNTINNNQKFNINVFLNEQCKNAINMSDFIKSLQIQLDDLMFTKDNGLIEGVSTVFVNALKQLDMYKRPIHCTDPKRETLYIKENNEWERDDNKEKLKTAINDVANKQRKTVSGWAEKNPEWVDSEEGVGEYIKLVQCTMTDVKNTPNENKIIKNIVKETVISKDDFN